MTTPSGAASAGNGQHQVRSERLAVSRVEVSNGVGHVGAGGVVAHHRLLRDERSDHVPRLVEAESLRVILEESLGEAVKSGQHESLARLVEYEQQRRGDP